MSPFVVEDNFWLSSSSTGDLGAEESLGSESSSTFSVLVAFGLRAAEFLRTMVTLES